MVSALDSGVSGPGLSSGRGHCVVFLGKTLKVHLTPKLFFGRDETVQHSHREFDNFISIWYF